MTTVTRPRVRSTRYLVVRSLVRIVFWSIPTAIGVGFLYALMLLAAALQHYPA